ncbi:conserved protein of unknown function [Acidithiobacillus ferrivorans]|uniref:Uncharacterized protein n=1 Tax=Acidithiobacillus ferrivorans TaxID=160808 RepID=A0A060UQU9_9PROT|nr:hypothetical protein [Acidithiobacillus ferrivorans]CDQ10666.1 conserved hypothetical protein [Acidithiobacillus ferrivorans]SMH64693.1 conserved protein of unknown function [Acidithiobacillus ferrivorans]
MTTKDQLCQAKTLPVLLLDDKGRVVISKNGKPIHRYVGIAFDYVCRAFVLVDMVRGWLEFMVSDTLENARMEAEYLVGKFR